MSLKFPNSDDPLRYKDLRSLEKTIAYLSGRLVEEKNANDGHVRAAKAELGVHKYLKEHQMSLTFKKDSVAYANDSGKFFLPDFKKHIFVEPGVLPREDGRYGGVFVNDVNAVVGIWSDPSLSFVDAPVVADDENTGVKRAVLANDEFELVVTLEIHSKCRTADTDLNLVSHDSSLSVGGASNPMEGEARKGSSSTPDKAGKEAAS